MMASLFLHEDDFSKTWFYMNFWIFNVLVDEIKQTDKITSFDGNLLIFNGQRIVGLCKSLTVNAVNFKKVSNG
jgi:hypothetical protein